VLGARDAVRGRVNSGPAGSFSVPNQIAAEHTRISGTQYNAALLNPPASGGRCLAPSRTAHRRRAPPNARPPFTKGTRELRDRQAQVAETVDASAEPWSVFGNKGHGHRHTWRNSAPAIPKSADLTAACRTTRSDRATRSGADHGSSISSVDDGIGVAAPKRETFTVGGCAQRAENDRGAQVIQNRCLRRNRVSRARKA